MQRALVPEEFGRKATVDYSNYSDAAKEDYVKRDLTEPAYRVLEQRLPETELHRFVDILFSQRKETVHEPYPVTSHDLAAVVSIKIAKLWKEVVNHADNKEAARTRLQASMEAAVDNITGTPNAVAREDWAGEVVHALKTEAKYRQKMFGYSVQHLADDGHLVGVALATESN